jgi:hypothetical protein
VSNHVPFRSVQISKRIGFGGKLLDPVLAEQSLPRVIRFADALRRLRLADGH